MSKLKSVRVTRAGCEVWLVGKCSNEEKALAPKGKLPTTQDVLRTFYANLHASKGTVSAATAAGETAVQVIHLWERASIPTREKRSVVQLILNLHKRHSGLLKDKHLSGRVKKPGSKLGETHEKRRDEFVNSIQGLFDIGHKDAFKIMTIQEDIDFYKSMQTDRRGVMLGIDAKYRANYKKVVAKEQKKLTAKMKSEVEKNAILDKRQLSELSELSTEGEGSNADTTDDEFTPNETKAKPITVNVLKNTLVTSALARTSTSSYAGTMILKAAVQATVADLGVEDREVRIVCSRSQLKRRSDENHKELSELIKQEFEPNCMLLVHFDGKLFPSTADADEKADRLPVVVSGKGVEKLLGIPELPHGSGECIAQAVVSLLIDWDLKENLMGLVFDTTSTNSGRWGGACVLIQQKLGKELLEFACRHHVLELVLGAVFDNLVGNSKSPDLLFGDFLKNHWKTIDKETYRTAAASRGLLKLIPNADEIIKFSCEHLQNRQPRDDYKELLELTIIFLGGSVPGKVEYTFRKPGATSKTRWMAKALYSYKIWMFGKQLKLTTAQSDCFFKVCAFLANFYVKNWFECPSAVKAPANDLALMRLLSEEKEPHLKAAFGKMANHLWYLSEKLVCLALFDDRVSLQEKRKMVRSIRSKEGTVDALARAGLPPNRKVVSLNLSDFATKNSLTFFEITKTSSRFMDKDPKEWPADPDFNHGLDVVRNIIPVNDIAERGVSLIKKYLNGNKLTHDESQRQFMLQAVEKHRSMYDKTGKEKI
ncbi:Replicase polyprotein 1ab [Frankliniella fusca]|uniref:Replicase polyprotein 1ab n=1 Tax=Frankliniella fusca TaxID=407009 RepID=A0AAE1HQA1_9NEOP|nr:Replicase polyprotein 1ab [Frankliniella fusca]